MTPTIYVGNHQHAKVVCSAFSEGCGGKLVPATSALQDGPAAMWGILRGAGDRVKECEMYGHPYFYIDHGYFSRGHYDGHYRVVFCDRHLSGHPGWSDGKRWEGLGLIIGAPKEKGSVLVYLPISRHVASFMGVDAEEFDAHHIARLEEVGPEVRVCPKGTGADFTDAAMVVGFQSNALIEASLAGYPVQELGRSPAQHLGGNRGRYDVFRWLADNQWTLEEMRSGKCWADLMERHGSVLNDALAA